MIIGGLQKFSLIDYPGVVCAVVFTQGCNFRCPYCHNPELVLPRRFRPPIPPDVVIRFLEARQGKLAGVTITGGEPTLQPDLLQFIHRTKSFGFQVKLDTNGSRPQVLQAALEDNLLDYVAMDIKAPLAGYDTLAGVHVNTTLIEESIELILRSNIEYQFRTTLVPSLHTAEMRHEVEDWMSELGAHHLFQEFISSDILDPSKLHSPHEATDAG